MTDRRLLDVENPWSAEGVVANRVVQCMLGMQKIDIAALQRAHRG